MSNDEIVRALRCRRVGKRKCARCPYKAEMSCTEAAMDDAASLIESLQAQLDASQRREQAAVEDITTMAKCKLLGTCTFCIHRDTPDTRYKPCKGCIQENRSRKHFDWRGPQEDER